MDAVPIAEVARSAHISSRTLRHYDDIGLLRPALIGSNGHRYYRRPELLRLQRILLLRELGLALDDIAGVLDGEQDEIAALRRHRDRLTDEAARIQRLTDTVSRTIDELEGGPEVADLFEGFAEKQAQAEEDMVARYGDGVRAHFAKTRTKTADWTKSDYLDAAAQWEAIDARMAAVLRSGAAPDSAEAFAVLDDHYAAIKEFWTPSAEAYTGLGGWYVENPEFRERYDAIDPRLAEFYRDAMAAYASARLT